MNRFYYILLLLFSQYCMGQNLVPNSSFEDVNYSADHCSPAGWFNVSRKHVTGYDHLQHIKAATGTHLLQIYPVTGVSTRDYWQTMFLCPLVQGNTYMIEVKVSAEKLGANLHDIGVCFSNSFIFLEGDTILQPRDYISFLDAKIEKLKNGWFRLEKQFVAKDNDRFIILGNFSGNPNGEIFLRQKESGGAATILVDDIGVKPVDSNACSTQEKVTAWLYSFTEHHTTGLGKIFNGDTLTSKPDSGTLKAAALRKPQVLTIDDIAFEINDYHFTDTAALDKFSNIFPDSTIEKIKVYGFTDNSGTEKFNRELSLNRAKETARLIILRFHVRPSLIEFSGRGISAAYIDKSKNRRVEVYIYRHE